MAKHKTFSEFPVKETIHVDPAEFVNLDADDSKIRGRYDVPSEEKMYSLAVSLRNQGQQNPVIARRNADGKLEIISGFGRANAVAMNRAGFREPVEGDKAKKFDPMPSFLCSTRVIECDDTTAMLLNITENSQRSELTKADQMENVVNLFAAELPGNKPGEVKHYTGKQIAEVTGLTTTDVSRLYSLRNLPAKAKDALHFGEIAFMTAVELAKVDNGLDDAEIEALLLTDGGCQIVTVQDYVRRKRAGETGSGTASPEGGDANPDETVQEPEPAKKTSTKRSCGAIVAGLSQYIYAKDSDKYKALDVGEAITMKILVATVNYANGTTTDEQFAASYRRAVKEINKLVAD